VSWQAWLTIITVIGSFGVMATDRLAPDKVMVMALAALVLSGVLDAEHALKGFANEGMMTVALLFIVAAAMRRSGAFSVVTRHLFGAPRSVAVAQLRLMAPVAALSAFVNNTPLVAMLLPEVRDWARARGVAPSRLLILLSYAAILGGVCTLIGTSTNLVVNGLIQEAGFPAIGFFEVGKLGIPFAVAGIVFCVLMGRVLIRDRRAGDMPLADVRAYTAIFAVTAGGPLVGKRLGDVTVPDSSGLNPIEIEREDELVTAPRAEEVLRAGDRLLLSAAAAEVISLERMVGLEPVADSDYAREGNKKRELVELVVSEHCPLVGSLVGQGTFRRHYDAAIIGIARHGERIVKRRDGGWVLAAGDTLLIEASDDFLALHRTSADFFLVTSHGVVEPIEPWHRGFGFFVFAAMIVCAATGLLTMFEAALAAALVVLLAGVISWREAQNDVNWSVLLMIATAFGLSSALESTGAAAAIGTGIVSAGGGGPWVTLALVYLGTVVTTEIVSNNAAAAMMLPVGLAAAEAVGASYMPFVMVVMIGGSAGFASPIGYQTHLMVYGPGGYRFTDFARIGIPLGLVLATVVIALAPLIWPF
jgi:di/tricarboxylate transporter